MSRDVMSVRISSEVRSRLQSEARRVGEPPASFAYYAAFSAEIDERIRLNEEALAEAEAIAAGRRPILG